MLFEIIGDGLFETFRFLTGISVDVLDIADSSGLQYVCTKGTTFSFKYIIFKLGNEWNRVSLEIARKKVLRNSVEDFNV